MTDRPQPGPCQACLDALTDYWKRALQVVRERPEMTQKESVEIVAWDLARAWLNNDQDETIKAFFPETGLGRRDSCKRDGGD